MFWPLHKRQGLERRIEIMQIQGPLVCFLLLAAQFGYAQEKARSLEDYFRQAKELETREDYSGAEKIYQEAAASYPRQPEILKRLGLIYQTELKFRSPSTPSRKCCRKRHSILRLIFTWEGVDGLLKFQE